MTRPKRNRHRGETPGAGARCARCRGRAPARGRPQRGRAGEPAARARRRPHAACRRARRRDRALAPARRRPTARSRSGSTPPSPRSSRCSNGQRVTFDDCQVNRHHRRPPVPPRLRGRAGGASAGAGARISTSASSICARNSARSATPGSTVMAALMVADELAETARSIRRLEEEVAGAAGCPRGRRRPRQGGIERGGQRLQFGGRAHRGHHPQAQPDGARQRRGDRIGGVWPPHNAYIAAGGAAGRVGVTFPGALRS